MTVRLVILGLLSDQPLYGYEIKQIIEAHMGDWTSIAFGSIYFALDKLAREKLVEKIAVEQYGNRPSRSIYQITDQGRHEFLQLLRESWQTVEREYYDIDICIFFFNKLPQAEIRNFIEKRLHVLEKRLEYLSFHEEEQSHNPELPPLARAIFDHTRVHIQSEWEWTKELFMLVNHQYQE